MLIASTKTVGLVMAVSVRMIMMVVVLLVMQVSLSHAQLRTFAVNDEDLNYDSGYKMVAFDLVVSQMIEFGPYLDVMVWFPGWNHTYELWYKQGTSYQNVENSLSWQRLGISSYGIPQAQEDGLNDGYTTLRFESPLQLIAGLYGMALFSLETASDRGYIMTYRADYATIHSDDGVLSLTMRHYGDNFGDILDDRGIQIPEIRLYYNLLAATPPPPPPMPSDSLSDILSDYLSATPSIAPSPACIPFKQSCKNDSLSCCGSLVCRREINNNNGKIKPFKCRPCIVDGDTCLDDADCCSGRCLKRSNKCKARKENRSETHG